MSSYGLPTRLGHSQRWVGVPWARRLCRGVWGVQAGAQGPGCPCWGGDPPWCAQMTPAPSVPPRSPGSPRPRVPRPRRAPPRRGHGIWGRVPSPSAQLGAEATEDAARWLPPRGRGPAHARLRSSGSAPRPPGPLQPIAGLGGAAPVPGVPEKPVVSSLPGHPPARPPPASPPGSVLERALKAMPGGAGPFPPLPPTFNFVSLDFLASRTFWPLFARFPGACEVGGAGAPAARGSLTRERTN